MSCQYLFANNFHDLFCTFCLVKLVHFASYAALSQSCNQSASVSKFWNIGGQSNIGEKNYENISFKKMISIGLYYR